MVAISKNILLYYPVRLDNRSDSVIRNKQTCGKRSAIIRSAPVSSPEGGHVAYLIPL